MHPWTTILQWSIISKNKAGKQREIRRRGVPGTVTDRIDKEFLWLIFVGKYGKEIELRFAELLGRTRRWRTEGHFMGTEENAIGESPLWCRDSTGERERRPVNMRFAAFNFSEMFDNWDRAVNTLFSIYLRSWAESNPVRPMPNSNPASDTIWTWTKPTQPSIAKLMPNLRFYSY